MLVSAKLEALAVKEKRGVGQMPLPRVFRQLAAGAIAGAAPMCLALALAGAAPMYFPDGAARMACLASGSVVASAIFVCRCRHRRVSSCVVPRPLTSMAPKPIMTMLTETMAPLPTATIPSVTTINLRASPKARRALAAYASQIT